MSMLQEILEKMYIDPELLDALGEEQKQMLFIKMREEQLKRWKANEERMEKLDKAENGRRKGCNKPRVKWATGVDGEVWVWVMGEHQDDRSIEEMIEEEEKAKAREIAEHEILLDTVQGDENFADHSESSLDEQALKNQLSMMNVSLSASTGLYDNTEPRTMETVESYNPKSVASYKPYTRSTDANNEVPSSSTSEQQNGNGVHARAARHEPPPIPTKPSRFPTSSPPKSNWNTYTPPAVTNQNSVKPSNYSIVQNNNFNRGAPLANENLAAEPSANEIVRMRMNGGRKASNAIDDEINKRQSEIFEQMQEKRERLQREAEREVERQRMAWEDQERKAREAEAQIREIAMKAREQHRKQSLRTSTSILPALKNSNVTSLRDAIKNLPRPPRPPSRKAIVEWFKKEELSRGTGLDPRTQMPALWFHGIISRDESEKLLANKPSGSFLVRVSERIWGYTVSYVVGDGSTKHFLIEKIADGYQFLGTNQVVHNNLFDLITYHETAPITAKGKEILKWSVGQVTSIPDHADLFESPAANFSKFTQPILN
ncbi:hypothetical protein L596_004534 [Steinernema carpocapsae]|uniref:SH2 domain-containing protein n=1 Tax=Steinernema carpocapsae TaxID=34508 RepID=A0A4V6I866_STECR|nr:hypothetical protein L596_004534 [Steinernema carpocapsae]